MGAMNGERSMSEFNRVKPKFVPENWRELGKAYTQEREAYMKSEEYEKLDDPRAGKVVEKTETFGGFWKPGLVYVVPTHDEVYSFFETVIANQDIAKLYFGPDAEQLNEWGGSADTLLV